MPAYLLLACFVAVSGLLFQTTQRSPQAVPADEWAQRVVERAGIDAWNDGRRLAFTFNVERPDGSRVSAKHDWDLRSGIDTVTWEERTVSINVWQFDPDAASEEEQAAFRRWTNDTYWLMAPLKLRDPGCNVADLSEGEMEGETYTRLHLSFDDVGLTPGDQYVLYVDEEGRVRYWDFMPDEERKSTWRWEGYETFKGLTLATERKPVGEGARIFFTDVSFERE